MMRNQKGFTLIELLIVVVIIGILAAIAIPKFGKTREKAYVAAMQSDLKQVMTAQEMYYGDPDSNYSYSDGNVSNIAGAATNTTDLDVSASSGVTVVITESDNNGTAYWSAVATHQASDQQCDVYVGIDATQGGVATVPGVIACGDKIAS